MSACPCLRQGFPKENGLRQTSLTRLARQARGGLFALRVTRRGHLEAWRLRGFEPKIEDWTGRYLGKLRILERLEDCYCN